MVLGYRGEKKDTYMNHTFDCVGEGRQKIKFKYGRIEKSSYIKQIRGKKQLARKKP